MDLLTDILTLKNQKQKQIRANQEKQMFLQHAVNEPFNREENQSLSIQKTSNSEQIQTPDNLFQNIIFCFPKVNVELSPTHIKSVTKTIEQYAGTVFSLDELFQCEGIPEIDYMLVGSTMPRQTIEQLLQKRVKYKHLLDFSYIFKCIKKGKLLNIKKFVIPYKSQELETYIRNRKIQQQLKKQQDSKYHPKVYKYEPGSGIEIVKSKEQNKNDIKFDFKMEPYNKVLSDAFRKFSEQITKQGYKEETKNRNFLYDRISKTLMRPSTPKLYTIQDVDKLESLRFFGPKTICKIREFIRTGTIEKMEILSGKEKNLSVSELSKVYGIGQKKAQDIYNSGIKSVEQLRMAVDRNQIKVSKNILTGLKYYEQLNQRIPYDEVTRIFEFIQGKFIQIVGTLSQHNIQVCGSYRRKAQTCGDMDIIISRKDGHFERDLLCKLINTLVECEFLTDVLTEPRIAEPGATSILFMGICQFEGSVHHRIDIKYYSIEEYPFALLYFTGSEGFNINMRNHALRMNYSLSDHGMWEVERIGTELLTKGAPICFISEQEIFNFLGIKYKLPEERSVI